MPNLFRIIYQSLNFYKKPVFYQFLIIALLSAVITGSLMTGRSVKESLKRSASERLGNTGILISSGVRYLDRDLGQRMNDSSGISCTGILEVTGYCQAMNSQKGVFNTHIFGVNKDFFVFQGNDTLDIKQGEIAVNKGLAEYLGIKLGDDLILRFKGVSDIPSDAPFAPAADAGRSLVMKVGQILMPAVNGNFSLSISQLTPMNIFVNLADLEEDQGSTQKINRLLIKRERTNSLNKISEVLKHNLKPADIGLKIRKVRKTGEYELISDRIFIDPAILNEIGESLPYSAPIITYLANRFEAGSRMTPYSFVSALPSSLYPEITAGNEMIINRWMAQDLSVSKGDTVKMFWYSPDSLNKLIERNSNFVIQNIAEMKGIWADSLLMPDFPGITGKESCSDWDAGVSIKMHEIRDKDVEYWNRYRGTPKAFISYKKGKELWGNNFGPATAVRFPEGLADIEIINKLQGSLDPYKMGLSITDLSDASLRAAKDGVDFGTLFLSLGFFLILASFVLLSFVTSSYFDTKKTQFKTLFALGFRNKQIASLLFFETGLISMAGCLIGAFAGYLVNIIIIKALNTVWTGAVQTDTLGAYFNFLPLISGFILTFLFLMVFMLIKVNLFLKGLGRAEKKEFIRPSLLRNLAILIISGIVTFSLFAVSILFTDQSSLFSFMAGTMLLITFILFWRQHYIGRSNSSSGIIKKRSQLSHIYYTVHPSNAVTPILFIAAGIFSVFITGANRMNFNDKQLNRSGGTGGYLLWCENTIPLKEDLNSESGKKSLGIDDAQLREMTFVLIKRTQGNDASCLNLNHVSAPPLLGVDPSDFIFKKSFSFSKVMELKKFANPWEYLKLPSENNTIFGIADQTVLDWGLKLKTGDTLVLRAENGQPLNIIVAAGLQSSVFQGNVLIGIENFAKYYPSVSGSSVLLVDGNRSQIDLFKNTLADRLEKNGVNIEKTTDRITSFYKVTNTYLSVFGLFGALGMIVGIAGLGFVLLRNYNQRRHEFALMLATGFNVKKIRSMILSEQMLVLFAGVSSGIISAIVATLPSLKNNHEMPWLFMILMVVSIVATGLITLLMSVRSITKNSLIGSLKIE